MKKPQKNCIKNTKNSQNIENLKSKSNKNYFNPKNTIKLITKESEKRRWNDIKGNKSERSQVVNFFEVDIRNLLSSIICRINGIADKQMVEIMEWGTYGDGKHKECG